MTNLSPDSQCNQIWQVRVPRPLRVCMTTKALCSLRLGQTILGLNYYRSFNMARNLRQCSLDGQTMIIRDPRERKSGAYQIEMGKVAVGRSNNRQQRDEADGSSSAPTEN